MLKAARRFEETGVNFSFVDDPWQAVEDWAGARFPEVGPAVREGVMHVSQDEDATMYRLMCLEDGLLDKNSLQVIAAAMKPAARKTRASLRESRKQAAAAAAAARAAAATAAAPTQHPTATPAAPTHASVPPLAPTQGSGKPGFSPWVKRVEQLDAPAAPAPSAPSPVPKAVSVSALSVGPMSLGDPVVAGVPPAAVNAGSAENAEEEGVQEDLAFMAFQGQMEQVMGNEAQRDEEAALKALLASSDLQGCAPLGGDPSVITEALQINEFHIRRHRIEDPPGFELGDDMQLTEVHDGTAASQAGLRAAIGQRLVQVDETFITSPSDLLPYYCNRQFVLGLMDMNPAPSPTPPAAEPTPPPPPAVETAPPQKPQKDLPFGFVFVACPRPAYANLDRILDGLVDMQEVTRHERLDTHSGALLMFSSSNSAEIASQSVHGASVTAGTLEAYMVWPVRGEPSAEDITAKVGHFVINLTPVLRNKKAVPTVRELEKWVDDDERAAQQKAAAAAPPQEGDELGDTAHDWDQFAANERLREAKGEKPAGPVYSDDLYSTKVDTSQLSAEQKERAERLAAAMGECTQDSLADKYADGYDEEDLHSAVLCDGNNQKVRSQYVLLCNVDVEITTDSLRQLGTEYGQVLAQGIYSGADITPAARAILKKRKVVEDEVYLLKFAKQNDAHSLVSDIDGMDLSGEGTSRARLCFLYERDEEEMKEGKGYSAETIVTLGGVALTLVPPLSSFSTKRKLRQWDGPAEGAKKAGLKGQLLEEGGEEIGDWDQFEANRKLGVKDSTYSLDLYSTKLEGATPQQKAEAERLAAEMQHANRDSLLAPDGEGDDDEEARHSAVNEAPVKAAPTPNPNTKPKLTDDSTCYVFLRGIEDMPVSEVFELLDGLGVKALRVHSLPRHRHPIGAAILEMQKRFVLPTLELDGLDLGSSSLLARLVFPPKVVDPDAFVEELDNGVMLDLSLSDASR